MRELATTDPTGQNRSPPVLSPSTDPYLTHFNLTCEPFGLTPGTEHLYLGRQHAEALAGLQIGIRHRRGLLTLVGEVGMGKTTLAHAVIEAMDERVHIGYSARTTLSFLEMMRPALAQLGLTDCLDDKAQMIRRLTDVLEIAHQRHQIVALIVDEAHNLSADAFEELRLLLNIENREAKLLQLVLIGQPELEDRLGDPSLRHLADRVAVRCVLNPLSSKESAEYVVARLEGSGASHDLFTSRALSAILREARGVPRSINVLCHNALLFAYGDGSSRVGLEHARTAIAERRGGRLRRLDRRRPWRRWLRPAALLLAGALAGLLLGLVAFRTSNVVLSSQPMDPPAGSPASLEGFEPAAGVAADAMDTAGAGSPMMAGGAPETTLARDRRLAGGGRTMVVETGSSLSVLILDVYGDYNDGLLEMVLDANPHVEDPDVVHEGQRIVLPALPPDR